MKIKVKKEFYHNGRKQEVDKIIDVKENMAELLIKTGRAVIEKPKKDKVLSEPKVEKGKKSSNNKTKG